MTITTIGTSTCVPLPISEPMKWPMKLKMTCPSSWTPRVMPEKIVLLIGSRRKRISAYTR
jgi:hypothetical protein